LLSYCGQQKAALPPVGWQDKKHEQARRLHDRYLLRITQLHRPMLEICVPPNERNLQVSRKCGATHVNSPLSASRSSDGFRDSGRTRRETLNTADH
jgi:hypothetical protein